MLVVSSQEGHQTSNHPVNQLIHLTKIHSKAFIGLVDDRSIQNPSVGHGDTGALVTVDRCVEPAYLGDDGRGRDICSNIYSTNDTPPEV